jgi:hypothetical protein
MREVKGAGPCEDTSVQLEGWMRSGMALALTHEAEEGMRSAGTVVGRVEEMGTGVEFAGEGVGSDGEGLTVATAEGGAAE